MIAHYDERTLKDLVSDSGTPVADLSVDTKLAAILDSATGAINAALQVGNLYKTDDLAALTGESLAYLKRLTCDIALAYLMLRRPEKYGSRADIQKGIDEILDQFRSGARIFDIPANLAASLPGTDGPNAIEYQKLNLIPDRTKNFYPHRATRLPIGKG